MFLYELNQDEKTAFLALAKEFIMADQQIYEGERSILALMCAEMSISEDTVIPQKDRKELFKRFLSRKSRVSAVLEMIGLGYADTNYSVEESEFIKEMTREFRISEADLRAMENWVVRLISLHQEVDKFWEESADKNKGE